MRPRAIPVLLIEDRYVVKTTRFREPTYVGDPINSVRIFNDKLADELMVLDIQASQPGRAIDFDFVGKVASEAFMPVAYGGGITTLQDAEELFAIGVEKVVLNGATFAQPSLVEEIAAAYGAQAVVASIDVTRSRLRGQQVVRDRGRRVATSMGPVEWAKTVVDRGAGEVLLTSVSKEGTRSGFDLDLIASVSSALDVPVIAHGGAGELHHLRQAVHAGASAVAAGSLFVHHGPRRAVLLTYPTDAELTELLETGIHHG